VLYIPIVGITEGLCLATIISTTSPLLSDTENLFPSFIGQLLMMEVAFAFLISFMAMENHCMKISMFLKSPVRDFRYFLRTPTAYPCKAMLAQRSMTCWQPSLLMLRDIMA
jgi:hypothetical protein